MTCVNIHSSMTFKSRDLKKHIHIKSPIACELIISYKSNVWEVKILSLTVCSFHRSDANILKDLNFFLSVRSSQVFELNNRRRLNKIDLQVINRRSKYFSDLEATTHFLPCKWYLLYQQEFFFFEFKKSLDM